jgi:hypothetical protein
MVLACAGIGTFYAAAHWTRSQQAQEDVTAQVARPAPATKAASSAMLAFAPASIVAQGEAPTAVAAAAAPADADRDPTLSLAARTRAIPGSKGDAFASLNWQPPPPPAPPPAPVKVVPPAPPPPPPMPFTFVGMLEQGAGKPAAFLSHGDALLVVSAGDLIENKSYRVDSLTPNAIVLTQLETNIQHTINVSWGTK